MPNQIGNNDTNEEIFEQGRDGYRRGWKNIPPHSIAAIRQGAVKWQEGWLYEKTLERPVA